MNPISRFVYWNMNYHVEHHMFPMVPFHALPALHAEIKDDLPDARPQHRRRLRGVRAGDAAPAQGHAASTSTGSASGAVPSAAPV